MSLDGSLVSGNGQALGEPGGGERLLGRDLELSELLAWLGEALEGQGRLILIGGEPGIGKSRIADEVADHGKTQGADLLWGKCWEGGGAPAYWPWVQCLRSYFRDKDPDVLRDQMGPGAVDIAQILPEVETLIGELPSLPSLDPESARFRLFDSTATFLRNAGNAGPLVVVIDDLHAADAASLLFLRFLAGQVSDMRILLLATYRDVELTPEHPLTSSLTDLTREPSTHHLMLGGLREPDVALLIERIAGVSPPAALVSKLHQQTNGNPLFVGEASRLLATEGGLSEQGEAAIVRFTVPEAVREVIMRRLTQLSDVCMQLLTLASVLGPEVPIEALRRVGRLSGEEFAEAVDEAASAGLLLELGGGLGRFRFSHDLVREVLYEAITPGQRARLHQQVAQTLEHLYENDLDRHLGTVAHHYFEGTPAGDATKAADYATRAAQHATRQLAYEEAVRLYHMALQATEFEESPDQVRRCDLLLGLGDAEMRAGDTPAAKETFQGAAGIARRIGLAEHLARAALGYGGRFVWMRAANDRQLVPLLTDGLTAVGEEDSHLRARLLARLAGALRDLPTPAPRDSMSLEAVEIARRLGDPATLAYALDGRYSAIWAPDTDDERLQIADEIVNIAETIGDTERAFQGHHYRLAVFLERGDISAVKAELEVNRRLAEDLRQPAQLWYAHATAAILALLEGRLEDAETLTAEAMEHGHRADSTHALGVELVQTYELRRQQGRAAELEGAFRELLDNYSFWPWMRCTFLHLYSEIDKKAEARSLFEAMTSRGLANLPWDNDWLMGMSLLSDVAVRLRDKERASALYELISPYSDRNGFGHPEFCTGSMSRPLGLLAGLLGWFDVAENHFEDAIVMNERMGARPWVAYCRYDLAAMLLSRDGAGDRERAEELLRQALAAAEEIGMVALEAKIRPMLGDSVEPPPALSGFLAPSVFRQEGEYWSISFEGLAVRLRDSKGLRHLARLLTAPGREFHVLDLVRMEEGLSESVRTGSFEPGLKPDGFGDAGEVLDAPAKSAYQERLAELQEELDEAESWHDTERVERARTEMEFLNEELAVAVGLGGRDRRAASAAERARVNVTRAIRAAMGRIADNHPELGQHLDTTIRTGFYCSYTPDTRAPSSWSF